MLYRKSATLKDAFAKVLEKFTLEVGGDFNELADFLFNRYTVDDFAYHDDMVYWGIIKYMETTIIPHKIAVYRAGYELLQQPWFQDLRINEEQYLDNLWTHDISKFCAEEIFGYAWRDWKNPDGPTKRAFTLAWHHHKLHNPHHPEYWHNTKREGKLDPLPMPAIYVAEMVADWIGAGKSYGKSIEDWLPDNLNKFHWHAQTAISVGWLLSKLGIQTSRVDNVLVAYKKAVNEPEQATSSVSEG